MTAVRNGYPVLENGRALEVSNVIWCTGYAPRYDWIELTLRTHNGLPVHDRGIVESCPGLYFVGLLFLYSLSCRLLAGVGRYGQEHRRAHRFNAAEPLSSSISATISSSFLNTLRYTVFTSKSKMTPPSRSTTIAITPTPTIRISGTP